MWYVKNLGQSYSISPFNCTLIFNILCSTLNLFVFFVSLSNWFQLKFPFQLGCLVVCLPLKKKILIRLRPYRVLCRVHSCCWRFARSFRRICARRRRLSVHMRIHPPTVLSTRRTRLSRSASILSRANVRAKHANTFTRPSTSSRSSRSRS